MSAGDEMLRIYEDYTYPSVDDAMDLGIVGNEFKDLRIDGLAYIDGFGEDTDMGDFDIYSIGNLYGVDNNIIIGMGTDGHLDLTADTSIDINGLLETQNIYPDTDDTYWLGKNDPSTPLGYKGLVLADTTDGNHYVIKVTNGAIDVIDVTDSAAL